MSDHKATIETIVNTIAIALTTYGVTEILKQNYYGFVVIIFLLMALRVLLSKG